MFGFVIDFIIILVLILFALIGYRRGFTKIIFGLICIFLSIIITLICYKPLAKVVIDKTNLDENISNQIYTVLDKNIDTDKTLIDEKDVGISKQVVKVINNYIKEATKKSEKNVFKYVSNQLSYQIVRLIVFIALLIVLRLVFLIISVILDIITKIPVLKQADESLGVLVNVLKALLIIYIFFGVVSIISPLINNSGFVELINSSKVGSQLYNNNVLLNLIFKGK